MLLPFDPVFTLRLGDLRFAVRLSTLLVLVLAGAGATTVRLEGAIGWIGGLATVAIVLGCFVAQLSARLWTGRRCGLALKRSHLAVFGAVSDGREEARTPLAEALIGAAGLAVLAGCAVAVVGLDLLVQPLAERWHAPLRTASVALCGLAILQAMPALSLDGGQLLRGLVWYLTDSPGAGARAAALYAQVVAAGLLAFGVAAFAFEGMLPYWGFWAVVAGWQLSAEARADLYQQRRRRLARAVALDDLIFPPLTVDSAATIDQVLDSLLASGGDAPFLVQGSNRQPVGVLRLANLRGIPRATWADRTVSDAMSPLDGLPRLDADRPAEDALLLLDELEGRRLGLPGAPVVLVERDGRPVAVLDRRRILVALQAARPASEPKTED